MVFFVFFVFLVNLVGGGLDQERNTRPWYLAECDIWYIWYIWFDPEIWFLGVDAPFSWPQNAVSLIGRAGKRSPGKTYKLM